MLDHGKKDGKRIYEIAGTFETSKEVKRLDAKLKAEIENRARPAPNKVTMVEMGNEWLTSRVGDIENDVAFQLRGHFAPPHRTHIREQADSGN